MFKNLKTSTKITYSFLVFNLLSLIVLLLAINITYFFVWYNGQKSESLSKIDYFYNIYNIENDSTLLDSFLDVVLEKDTILIPLNGEPVCAASLEDRAHDDLDSLIGKRYYSIGDNRYIIYSKDYPNVGKIKIFFDTTMYIESQLIIIKISFLIIFLFSIFIYFFGKKIIHYSIKDLTKLSNQAKNIKIDGNHLNYIKLELPSDDEISILANALNSSFDKVNSQVFSLRQFIGDVSHEFKTPLMTMSSKIDLYEKKISRGDINKNELIEFFEYNKNNIKKLNKTIETFFMLSRLEESINTLQKTQTNIYSTINIIVNDLKDLIYQKNIEIVFIGDKNLTLDIESSTFSIMIENLIVNAIKFSKNNSKIEIGIFKDKIIIKDFGEGIENDKIKNIWDKYFKNGQYHEGFGLGLFIVSRIIKLYNWNIDVKSDKGVGTEFIIYFG